MMRLVLPVAALLLLALAACETDEATPSPIPSAGATPAIPGAARAIFLAGATKTYPPSGELWISNLDGSGRRQLTPDNVNASFAGLVEGNGKRLFYYVALDGGTSRSLWKLDLNSGDRQKVIEFHARQEWDAYASVSPDGRYAAYTEIDSIGLLDTETGQTRRLLTGNAAACDPPGGAGRCFVYRGSMWSPDGQLMVVTKGFYEGSSPALIDPFASAIEEREIGPTLPLAPAAWSPESEAICAIHSYGETGLYLARAPDWQIQDLVPEYNVAGTPAPRTERRVADCDWLSPERIAFATAVADIPAGYPAIPEWSVEVSVFDLAQGKPSNVAVILDGIQMADPSVFALTGGHLVLIQYMVDRSGSGDFVAGQPQMIDTTTSARRPVLQPGDWVVDVVEMPTP